MKKILITFIAFVLVLLPIQSLNAETSQACPTLKTRIITHSFSNCINGFRTKICDRDWETRQIKKVNLPSINIYNSRWGTWFKVIPYKDLVKEPEQNPIPQPKPVPKPSTPTPKPSPEPKPSPAPEADFSAMQQEMLGYINAERANANIAPLVLDQKLCQGAYLKSRDMAVNNYFSHTSPTYGSPFEMMRSQGITYRTAGENIAKNISVKGAHTAFMNSAGHKANILNKGFGKIGLGFYQEGQYLYITQWFTN